MISVPRATSLTLAVLAVACGGSGDDDAPPPCAGTHFAAEPTDWLLPDFGPEWAIETADQINGDVNWALLDLDGDQRLDLVVAQDPNAADVGRYRWIVRPNTGSGFGDPVDWTLPDLGPEWATETTDRSNSDVNWALLDLDDDQRLDLIVTQEPGVADVGRYRWVVYRNTGTGFGDPVDWTLPDLGPEWAIATYDRSNSDVNWALLDLDGEGGVELVVTQEPGVADVGRYRWVVYANTGTGFGDATDWTLPDLGPAWATVPYDIFSSDVNWALLDLDGKDGVELVVTQEPGVADVGRYRWVVHTNTGTGFGDATDWTLPDLGPEWAVEPTDRFSSDVNWGLLDLDGQPGVELVVTQDPTAADVGTARWVTYRNSGTGFGETADWLLPNVGPMWATELVDRFSSDVNWTLLDLDGDRRTEVVVSQSLDAADVGRFRWQLFANQCD